MWHSVGHDSVGVDSEQIALVMAAEGEFKNHFIFKEKCVVFHICNPQHLQD